MLQLAEPIEQTIKLYFDRRPELREKFSNSERELPDSDNISLSAHAKSSFVHSRNNSNMLTITSKNMKTTGQGIKNRTAASSKSSNEIKKINCKTTKSFGPKLENRIFPSDEKQHIVRTVLMPEMDNINNNNNTSNEENEFLRKQLVELKNFYENHIFKLEEDRRLREEEHRLGTIDYKEKLEDSIKKNQKLERINYELTKEFMQLKFDSSNGEKEKFEEVETLKCQNEALAVSLKEVIYRTNIDKESARVEYERKTKEVSTVMRSQVYISYFLIN